jgi:uncharacterized protein YoxC
VIIEYISVIIIYLILIVLCVFLVNDFKKIKNIEIHQGKLNIQAILKRVHFSENFKKSKVKPN